MHESVKHGHARVSSSNSNHPERADDESRSSRGKAGALKGKSKQAADDLTGDLRLRDRGVADEAAGRTKDALGDAKRNVGETVEHIGKMIKK